ncbi:hypothetical protein [Variovorax sp. J31P207]|uniref:hypothetical protein n=1 Tax=Variovorax sp. J31P207 TaxID=3053510 RepID=UPI002578F0AC|nr:hypothetical protein [Variovorax sp. J31P207]MDM0067063.1 hypothetical protein [Variovorax sp. J31P207]
MNLHLFISSAMLEWSGSLFGLTGALLLATNSRLSRYGWIAFLIANFCMLGFAIDDRHWGLLTQQAGFTATSLLGIVRSGLLNRVLGRQRCGGG